MPDEGMEVSEGPPRTTYVVASLGRSATVPVHVTRYAASLASEQTPAHLILLINLNKYPELKYLEKNWNIWVWPFIEESKRAFLQVSFQFNDSQQITFKNRKESQFILAGGDQRWLLELYLEQNRDGDKLLSDFDEDLKDIKITGDEWLEIVRLRGTTDPKIQTAVENVEKWLKDFFQVNENQNNHDPTRLILGPKKPNARWFDTDKKPGSPQLRQFIQRHKNTIANLPGSILKFSHRTFDNLTTVKFHPDLSKYLRHSNWRPSVDRIELLLITPKDSVGGNPDILKVMAWDSGNSARSAERMYAALDQGVFPLGLLGFIQGDLARVKETLERLDDYHLKLELHETLEHLGYDDVCIDLEKGFNGKQIAMALELFKRNPENRIRFDSPDIGVHCIEDRKRRWTALRRSIYHHFQWGNKAVFPKDGQTKRHTSYPFQNDAGGGPRKILFTHAPYVPPDAQKGRMAKGRKMNQKESSAAFPEHRVLVLNKENKPLFLLNVSSSFLCEFLFIQMIEIHSHKTSDESLLMMKYEENNKSSFNNLGLPCWILDQWAHFTELNPKSASNGGTKEDGPPPEDGPTPEAWMYDTDEDALMVFDAKCRGFEAKERQNLTAEIRSVASKYLWPRNSGTMNLQVFSAYESDMDHNELQQYFHASHGYLASRESDISRFGLKMGFDLSTLSEWFFGMNVAKPYINGQHQSETVRELTSCWDEFASVHDKMYRKEHLELIRSGEEELSTTSSVAFLFFPKDSKPGEAAVCIKPTPMVKIVEWVARGLVSSEDLEVEAEGNEFVIHHHGKKRIFASEFVDVMQTMETFQNFLEDNDSETFSSYLESKLLFGTIADVIHTKDLDNCRALLHQLNLLDGLDVNLEPRIALSKSLVESTQGTNLIDCERIRTLISERIRSNFKEKHSELFDVKLFKDRYRSWPWNEFLETFKNCIYSDETTKRKALRDLCTSASNPDEDEIVLYAQATPFVFESISQRLDSWVGAMRTKFSGEELRWPAEPRKCHRVLFGAVWVWNNTNKDTSFVQTICRFLGIEQDMISSPSSFTDLIVIHAIIGSMKKEFERKVCVAAFHQLWSTKKNRKKNRKQRKSEKNRFKEELQRMLNQPDESSKNEPVS